MTGKPEKVLLATRNQGKVREMTEMLAPLDIQLVGVSDLETALGDPGDVPETGSTFSENSWIKARAYAAWSGLPVIAEDSGLEVDALDGAPGVYSSRFAGTDGDDNANNAKLLQELADIPDHLRTARYRTVAVFLDTDGTSIECAGIWDGSIAKSPAGSGGFGYDPLFWVESDGCTSAQLSALRKNQLSHRGKAVRDLVEQLAKRW